MRNKFFWIIPSALAGLIAITASGQQTAQAPLDAAEFQQLHRALQPPRDEAWTSIPWRASLLEAQALAAREKKPIFIWAMDGNPLGCG